VRRIAILLAAVGALLLVPAASAFAETVTVEIGGTGEGEVNSTEGLHAYDEIYPPVYTGEPPIECSYASPGPQTGTCENELEDLEEGFSATELWETPAPGSEFAGWTITGGQQFGQMLPGCFENQSETEFENNWRACFAYTETGSGSNVTVTATFNAEAPPAEPNLKLNIEEGEGTVVSSPAGISCGSECEAAFEAGEAVTLTASPAPGYLFKSWKKCDKKETIESVTYGVNGRQCTIKAGESLKEVGVKFVKSWDLTASKGGEGIGKLQSKPGGVLCLPNCSSATAAFKDGFTVEVTNKPNKHHHFVEFANGTGSASSCTGESTCSFTIGSDSSVEGVFEEDTKYALSLTKTGGGQGSIKTKPSGILCAYTCSSISADFYEGETAEVIWKLNKGTTTLEWTTGAGTCTGSTEALEGTCTVPMSSAQELVADFS